MNPKLIAAAAMIASAAVTNASILAQELFDGISAGDATLDGAGSTATTVGLGGVWTTHASQGIFTADNFDVDGFTLPGLPSNAGAAGGLWNNTGSWNSAIYATRPLDTPISFAEDREIFFSVRLNNSGDTAMGVGLAGGATPDDPLIGAGFSWNNARSSVTGENVAGNAAYISHGTFRNTTVAMGSVPDVLVDGVYAVRASEPAGSVNGYGLLVGRITIRAGEPDTIHIKRYAENQEIDDNLEAVTWTATSSVDLSIDATHLVLWLNGNGGGELDAIRFGDTWTDVTGVDLAGPGQPTLFGAAVTSVDGSTAQAEVNLIGSQAEVTLRWGTWDAGTGSWDHANALGQQPIGKVTGAMTGLEPDTRYYYRFHARNTAAVPALEAWSETDRSFVTAPTGLAVNDLFAQPFSPFEVDLYWSDFFLTETSYLIQRAPAGTNNWVTIGEVGENATVFTDKHSGLSPGMSYDYRVIGRNPAGDSAPSNVATVTTDAAAPLETALLVRFDGALDGETYLPGAGEIDITNSFRANGSPVVGGGLATLNPGNEGGPDGFDINGALLGDLTAVNWVIEIVVAYESTGTGTTPVLIDVQGDTNLRLRSETDDDVLQMFYYNGSAVLRELVGMPPPGTRVHLALAWDASTATLTGYINGTAFGSLSGGPFDRPDPGNISFGYFGRSGFEGRGIDGVLDAIAMQTGTSSFDPATDFLILPETTGFDEWISGFPVGGQTGFTDDPDGDGLPNGVEAVFGSNAAQPSSGGLVVTASGGSSVTFVHPLAATLPEDVGFSYEWSTNLVDWYDGDGADGAAGGLTMNIPAGTSAGGMTTVTATASQPVERIFIRLVARR